VKLCKLTVEKNRRKLPATPSGKKLPQKKFHFSIEARGQAVTFST
jgi:hypothetical protein